VRQSPLQNLAGTRAEQTGTARTNPVQLEVPADNAALGTSVSFPPESRSVLMKTGEV
jgi:hypothetical protein